jgi:endonuclease YncB( thermonuclease family)
MGKLIFFNTLLIVSIFLYSEICLSVEIDPSCEHTPTSFNCVTYLYNYDGDTFKVDIPGIHPFFGKGMPIRVAGLDTAELQSKNACERKIALLARQRTQEILSKAKRIDLVAISPDKYFRVDASVIVDTTINLGYTLLKENLAYPYDGKTKPKIDWCSMVSSFSKK